MADYYPLVAKAIAGLEKNTGEGRRTLYERARTALVAQLRGMNDPPLTEAEITRERLALEEAIRKVEAEAARRGRSEAPAASRAEITGIKPEPPAPPPMPEAPRSPPPPAPERPVRQRAASRSVTDEGLRGFRDVIAETEGLGEATAQAGKTAREVFAATAPTADQTFDRVEPRVEPEGLRTPLRPPAFPNEVPRAQPEPPRAPEMRAEPRSEPRSPEPRSDLRASRNADPRSTSWSPETWPPPEASPVERVDSRAATTPRQGPMRAPSADDIDELPKRSRVGLVAALVAVLVIVGAGAVAFLQRDRIAGLVNVVRGPVNQTPKDAQPTRPKINDRVGQPAPADTPAQQTQAQQSAGPVAAVAQRVVLYEEDPADQQGKRYVGSAIWKTETVTPGPGAAPDLAVRADLEIPDRRITMTFSLRRNTDQALPASHTIEVTFNLPADFPFGGISNVPGILMKQAEQTRGAPLAGLAVKVTSGFFLVGLSAVEADMQRNLQLLKERSWFDIPIVYNNGRRAILAIEKGTPGERAFDQVFKAWGQ